MKKIIPIAICVLSLFVFSGCNSSSDYLRVHIRANSNSEADQNVKYLVKDVIVDYMTPLLKDVTCKQDVIDVINSNSSDLVILVNGVLKEQGFDYGCSIAIDNEFFPTRTYGDLTLVSDYYDALIVKLGSGGGNNWWCVMYPNMCFNEPTNVVYRSKIKEIINHIMGE